MLSLHVGVEVHLMLQYHSLIECGKHPAATKARQLVSLVQSCCCAHTQCAMILVLKDRAPRRVSLSTAGEKLLALTEVLQCQCCLHLFYPKVSSEADVTNCQLLDVLTHHLPSTRSMDNLWSLRC